MLFSIKEGEEVERSETNLTEDIRLEKKGENRGGSRGGWGGIWSGVGGGGNWGRGRLSSKVWSVAGRFYLGSNTTPQEALSSNTSR